MINADLGRFTEIGERYHALLEKVTVAIAGGANSYELAEDERKIAKELVGMGLFFYSMDYDHVATYRPSVQLRQHG